MSSLVRRIQKKIAISQGYKRFGAGILTPEDKLIKRWPQVKAPTKEKK